MLKALRSADGGASFDPPRELFNAAGAWHVYDTRIAVNDDGKLTIGFKNQCNWQVNNAYIIMNSNDGGNTFTQTNAYSTETGSGWSVSDLQRTGDNIYVLYSDAYFSYGLQYKNLYLAASSDGGLTFNSQLISVASANGSHKTGTLQDEHYVPKIAAYGNNVYVTWSGLDSEDGQRIFFRGSSDSGSNFGDTADLSKTELPSAVFQQGLETIAAKGNYVYLIFVTTDGKIYLKRSDDAGRNFYSLQEITASKGTYYVDSGWWPLIQTEPSDETGEQVHILWRAPTYRYSSDGGETFTGPVLLGPHFSWRGIHRPQMAVGSDGAVHYVAEGSCTWYSTGVFGDSDIFYRRYDTQADEASGEDMSVHFASKSNAGDGTGDERYDNMQIPAGQDINFTSAMTAEVWIKPGSGSEQTVRILFKEDALTYHYVPKAYQIGTYSRSNERRPSAGIRTASGEYSNWGGEEIRDNVWTHLAMTYDAAGGTDNFKLYVNGRLSASQTVTGELTAGDGILFVAGKGSSEYFNGEMDELRLWSKALDGDEISSNMNRVLQGNEPGLAAYYNFNNTARDMTGHGNNGVLMYKESYVVNETRDADINGDDQTDLTDAVLSFQIMAGHGGSQRIICNGADINGDGRIGLEEAIHILQTISEGV
jgi:hypothetical protein